MSAAGNPPTFDQAFATLRQFARSRPPVGRCELCSAGLAHEHPHLVEIRSRQIVCACEACATLFDGMPAGKYRRVSRRAQFLANFQMTDAQWETLLIPINMAFFFQSSVEGKVIALYPSPAGAVESLLSLDAWNEVVRENPILGRLQPDIEALLVNRVGHAHELAAAEYYIAPIDACYKLVGLIRANWKGLSGGSDVWEEIGRFFSELRSQADLVNGDKDWLHTGELKFASERRYAMALELVETTANGNDKDTLYMLGGISLMVFGAGLILSNPFVRRYMSQIGVGNLASAAMPDIQRYFKLRAMSESKRS